MCNHFKQSGLTYDKKGKVYTKSITKTGFLVYHVLTVYPKEFILYTIGNNSNINKTELRRNRPSK